MVIQKRASVINGKSLYGKRWKLLGIKEESFVQTPATGLIMDYGVSVGGELRD